MTKSYFGAIEKFLKKVAKSIKNHLTKSVFGAVFCSTKKLKKISTFLQKSLDKIKIWVYIINSKREITAAVTSATLTKFWEIGKMNERKNNAVKTNKYGYIYLDEKCRNYLLDLFTSYRDGSDGRGYFMHDDKRTDKQFFDDVICQIDKFSPRQWNDETVKEIEEQIEFLVENENFVDDENSLYFLAEVRKQINNNNN